MQIARRRGMKKAIVAQARAGRGHARHVNDDAVRHSNAPVDQAVM
jgi:hypothetical protein